VAASRPAPRAPDFLTECDGNVTAELRESVEMPSVTAEGIDET
jgi:hypothetical protein